jgi:hypothetical protein
MGFYQEAEARIHKELPSVKGQKEGAIKGAVKDALLNFARQEEEFAQAIVQGGSFGGCMAAVCKGIGTSISDLEAYRRAAAYYFPGSDVRFEMRIELAGEAGTPSSADAAGTPSASSADSSLREGANKGLVIDLADFL